MFSQFRTAVEHLAQQQQSVLANRPSASNSDPSQSSIQPAGAQRLNNPTTSQLDDSQRMANLATPGQLAESVLQNFRKTLVSSRPSPAGPSQFPENHNGRQTRSLEERLRASFTLGDLSERTTPDTSKLPSPGEVEPAAIALPLSPEQERPGSALEDAFDPLGAQLSPNSLRNVRSPPPVSTESEQGAEKPSSQLPSEVEAHMNGSDTSPVASSSTIRKSPPRAVSPLSLSPLVTVNMATPPPDATSEAKPDEVALAAPVPNIQVPNLSDSGPYSPRPLSPFVIHEKDLDVEKLHARLKLVEQRFSDVSTSFKRLRAEKRAVDQVLKELTPLESMSDTDGLREHLKGLELQNETKAEQIMKLNGKLRHYDLRLEELRDTHRLETSSQSEQVERLRKQVSEAEALLKVGEEASNESKIEMEQLRADAQKAKGVAKEEEEKRTKAISLLKTVRAKLVKSEKEKDDAVKEAAEAKEKERETKEKEHLDRARLELDLERAKLEKDREVASLRTQFDREMIGLKDRLERENAARKGQLELEAITTKAAHAKELAAKTSRIATLETSIRTLSQEKDTLFDQLQMRQAELESSQSHLDSVEARSTELQHQLREAEDRVEVLTEALAEIKGNLANSQSLGSSAEELARILSETEGKYEARISDLRSKMRALEKERHDAEDEWSKNLQERSRELEKLRRLFEEKEREYAESIRGKAEMEARLVKLDADNNKLRTQTEAEKSILLGLQSDIDWLKETEASMKQERDELHGQVRAAENQLEQASIRERVLKTNNKTLREELRKVQSSAALLERQRNPGIGYWNTSPRSNGFTQSAVELQDPGHLSRSSVDEGSSTGSPTRRPSSPVSITPAKNEEEINLEYLRNVILQFLEHKDMRPNLVRVLSVLLHFTPQETRRVIAKV